MAISLLLWTHKRRAPLLYFSLMHCQFYKPTRWSQLEKTLQLLGNNWRVPLQWKPAHRGVPGNEQAGANVSCQENVTIAKALMIPSH